MQSPYLDAKGSSIFQDIMDTFDPWAEGLPHISRVRNTRDIEAYSASVFQLKVQPAIHKAAMVLDANGQPSLATRLRKWERKIRRTAEAIDAYCQPQGWGMCGYLAMEEVDEHAGTGCLGADGLFQRFQDDIYGMADLILPDDDGPASKEQVGGDDHNQNEDNELSLCNGDELHYKGKTANLERKPYNLLGDLLKSNGYSALEEDAAEHVWPREEDRTDSAMKSAVSKINKALTHVGHPCKVTRVNGHIRLQ